MVPSIGCSSLNQSDSRFLVFSIPAALVTFAAICTVGAEGFLIRALHGRSVHIHTDGDAIAGITAVIQVVAVTRVVNVNVIVVIPVIGPIFRPGIGQAEPKSAVLKAGISADNHDGVAVDAEGMIRTEVAVVAIFRNAVSVVATALLPVAMFRLPVTGAMLLPDAALFAFLPVLLLLGLHVDLLSAGPLL